MNRAYVGAKRPFFSPVQDLAATDIANSIIVGLLFGIMIAMVAISFAAFVFGGELARFLSQSSGLFLFGAALLAIPTSFLGSTPGLVTSIQDVPSPYGRVIG